MQVTLAHSPDPDDAFMFYALAADKVDAEGLRFRHVLSDIESLNQAAREGRYEVTAISFHAYPYVAAGYDLLTAGASFGERYGPRLVARAPIPPWSLRGRRVAVPGMLTTAYLALKLALPDVVPVVVPFDRILDAVLRGEVDAGLVIHEGQLTYADHRLYRILDLGEWWHDETRLPLPLGGNAVRRGLPGDVLRRIDRVLRASIRWGLEHREEALTHALKLGRGIDRRRGDAFVGMYVNRWTVEYGETGRRAVRALLERGWRAGIIPIKVEPKFVS